MSKIKVLTQEGKAGSEIELNPQVFESRINERLLELILVAYAGNQRRGTHDTKTRREVRGGGKKPWKQKGTGRARHSSRRSPIWRGGGTVFGPHPHDYDTNLPDHMKRDALVSALSLKYKENNILFLEDLAIKAGKTKELAQVITNLGLDGSRALCIVQDVNESLKRASRNIKERFSVRRSSDVNAYHICRRKKLIIARSALQTIEARALGLDTGSKEAA